jgi:hypothetical protein
MPPESSRGRFHWAGVRFTSAMNSSVSRFRSFAGTPGLTASTASATFSNTLSHGRSEYCWKTMPRSGPGPVTGAPSRTMLPASGGMSPPISETSVVLPEPE